jgi:cation transport ATPase
MDALQEQTPQTQVDWEESEEQSIQADQEDAQQIEKVDEEEPVEETKHDNKSNSEKKKTAHSSKSKTGFVHGLAAGLGIGCIAAFAMMWTAVFFTPRLSPGITYESMLSVFIYPLIYLLGLGLVTLTIGIIGEYYAGKIRG